MSRVFAFVEGGRITETFSFPDGLALPADVAGRAKVLPPGVQRGTHFYNAKLSRFLPIPPAPAGLGWSFDYPAGNWVFDSERAWTAVRAQRDARLAECDWIVARSTEAGGLVPEVWRVYRQALRDITEQSDPVDIDWPSIPA